MLPLALFVYTSATSGMWHVACVAHRDGRERDGRGLGQLPPAEAGRATLLCVIESINLMSSRREFALSDGTMKYSDRLSKNGITRVT